MANAVSAAAGEFERMSSRSVAWPAACRGVTNRRSCSSTSPAVRTLTIAPARDAIADALRAEFEPLLALWANCARLPGCEDSRAVVVEETASGSFGARTSHPLTTSSVTERPPMIFVL